jgi:hypothetical protein
LLHFSPEPKTGTQPLSLQHLAHYQIPATSVIGARLSTDFPGTKVQQQFGIDGTSLQVDLFTHITSSKKEEIVPYIGRLINSSQWNNEQQLNLTTAGGQSFDTRVFRRVGSQIRILVARQYVVGRYQTANYFYAKLIQIFARAAGDNYFGLLVVQVNCAADCNEEIVRIQPALDKIAAIQ